MEKSTLPPTLTDPEFKCHMQVFVELSAALNPARIDTLLETVSVEIVVVRAEEVRIPPL
jgi:hypothetical protein